MTAPPVGYRTTYSVGQSGAGAGEGSFQSWPYHHDLSTGPGLWWAHNGGAVAATQFVDVWRETPQAFASRGFLFQADDNAGANHYCNAAARATVAPTVAYLRARCRDPYAAGAASMGAGLTALHAAAAGSELAVICWCVPVVDWLDVYNNDRGGTKAAIAAAHGGEAAFLAARPLFDPLMLAPSIADTPVHLWYASDDPVCLPSTMTAFAAAHGNTTLHNMGAVGHIVAQQFTDEAPAVALAYL